MHIIIYYLNKILLLVLREVMAGLETSFTVIYEPDGNVRVR